MFMETTQTQKEQMEVAQMRFGVIAPVQGTYTDISMSAYCHRVARTPLRLPDGRAFQYKPKTVAEWYQLYAQGGMVALIPRTRCDKGGTRVITEDAEEGIRRLRREPLPGERHTDQGEAGAGRSAGSDSIRLCSSALYQKKRTAEHVGNCGEGPESL